MRIATGLPARPTTTAPPEPVSSANTSSTEAPRVDGRERGLHRHRDVVVQRVGVPEDAIEEAALLDRADDVGQLVRGLVPDDRELRDAVALHQVDRGADLLVRVDDHELRHAADRRRPWRGSPRRRSGRARAAP